MNGETPRTAEHEGNHYPADQTDIDEGTRVCRVRHGVRRRRRWGDGRFFAGHPCARTYTRAPTDSEMAALTAALGVPVHGEVQVARDGTRVFVGSFRLRGGVGTHQ